MSAIKKEAVKVTRILCTRSDSQICGRFSWKQPNSAALFYRQLREIIAYYLEQEAHDTFDGAVELDESYFGGARKGKRGRGATGKVAVFGILKRGGKVYTKVVINTKSETLMPLIARKIAPDSVVYTDCYRKKCSKVVLCNY